MSKNYTAGDPHNFARKIKNRGKDAAKKQLESDAPHEGEPAKKIPSKTLTIEDANRKVKKEVDKNRKQLASEEISLGKGQKLTGGKGDNLKPEDVDQKQLSMGIEVEKEHTNDPDKAKEIALDHLAEDPKYYSKLKTIEAHKSKYSTESVDCGEGLSGKICRRNRSKLNKIHRDFINPKLISKSFPEWETYFEVMEKAFPEWENMSDDEFHDALYEVLDNVEKAKKDKPFKGYNPKKHSKTGGLNAKYRRKYNKENDSNLKRPVTEKNPKGKKLKRKRSFCARMKGVKGPTSKDGKLTPKGAALKRWRCSKSVSEATNDLFKNRCWEGYEPVPGKKPYSEGSCRKKKSKKSKKEFVNDFKKSYNFRESNVAVDSKDIEAAEDAPKELVEYLRSAIDGGLSKMPLSKGELTLYKLEDGLYSGYFSDQYGQVSDRFHESTIPMIAKALQIKEIYAAPESEDPEELEDSEEEESPKHIRIKCGDFEFEMKKSLNDCYRKQKPLNYDQVKKSVAAWRRNMSGSMFFKSNSEAAKELIENWDKHKEGFFQVLYANEKK